MYSRIVIFCVLLQMVPDIALSMDRPAAGTLTRVRGVVTVRSVGEASGKALKSGENIRIGHILTAAPDGWAQLALTDGSMITVLPDTTVFIKQYSYTPDTGRRTAVIKVIDGRVRFFIYTIRSGESRFTVETDHALLNVGMSDFFVNVSASETEITNIGPPISVKNISSLTVGEARLNSNQKTILKDKTPPSQPATVPPDQRRSYLDDAAR
jgi:hypothetical protein